MKVEHPENILFVKDLEILHNLREENTNRLRILLLFPIAVSIGVIVLNLRGIIVFPWQAPLPVLIAGTVPYIILFTLLWISKTAHSRWLHLVIVGMWVLSMLVDPFTSQSDIIVFEFFLNLLLINLFIFIPPLIILSINCAAFVCITLNLGSILKVETVPSSPITVGLIVVFLAIVFVALTIMSIHEYRDAVTRIRREREMQTQRDELIRLNKMRDDVDRIIRHDLKNPLNGIIGVAEILRMEPDLPEVVREFTPILEQSGYTMLHMINNSLDIYKMEEGTYEIKAAPLNCRELLASILTEFESSRRQKELDIRIEDKTEKIGATVMGEREKIHSMFSNLIKNAVEASPEHRPITVTLECKSRSDVQIASGRRNDASSTIPVNTCTSEWLSVDIHNFGTVPEDIRPKFFERYVTSGKKHGTGLGTYSAALIARVHKGNIRFTTSEEEGTHIVVELPLYREEKSKLNA